MLTFNLLLKEAGLPIERVRLLRHQDTRMKKGWSPYRLWRHDPVEFNRYESAQIEGQFKDATYVASFVVDPVGDLVFAGVSHVRGGQKNTERVVFDYLDQTHEQGQLFLYDLVKDERFGDFEGKLVIDWGAGTRSWVQRADNQDKPIIELRRDVRDVEWPGYENVLISVSEVPTLAPNWCAKLSAASGVYLLVCPVTGEQYVGAAFGVGGFLSRWMEYARDGHGGNKHLRARVLKTKLPMQASILEVFGSRLTEDEAYQAESRWKQQLGSRAHGLNAN